MQTSTKLAAVRALHTVIYLVLASSVFCVVFAGLGGYRGPWLTLALILTTLEGVVFIGNGRRCPLTALARRYGAEKGWAFDAFLPERWTRYTFRVFGALLVVGLVGLIVGR